MNVPRMCLVVKVYIYHRTGKNILVAPKSNELGLLLQAYQISNKWLNENAQVL